MRDGHAVGPRAFRVRHGADPGDQRDPPDRQTITGQFTSREYAVTGSDSATDGVTFSRPIRRSNARTFRGPNARTFPERKPPGVPRRRLEAHPSPGGAGRPG